MKKKQRHSMLGFFGRFLVGLGLLGFFVSVYNSTGRPWDTWSSKWEDPECRDSGLPLVNTGIVKGQPYQLNVHNPVGPDTIHPTALKKLADVTVGCFLIICQSSGEVPVDWKLANNIPVHNKGMREDPGSYRSVRELQYLEKLWRRSYWVQLKDI